MHAHTHVFTHTSYLHLRVADTFSQPTALRLIRNKPDKIHTFNSLSPTGQTDGWITCFPGEEKSASFLACLRFAYTFIREQCIFIGLESDGESRLSTQKMQNRKSTTLKPPVRNRGKTHKPRHSISNADFFEFFRYRLRRWKMQKMQKISARHLGGE